MTATTPTWRGRALDFGLAAPLRAALTHGNQALITLASAYMNAQFAQSHGILDPWIAWALAIGYEWTYLRGLASSDQVRTPWTTALNIVAFVTAIVGGLLYAADKYHALPPAPDGLAAWLLAAAHVIPMALLSLCSAMVHRAASDAQAAIAAEQAERARARQARLEDAADALKLEEERKRLDLTLWAEARAMQHRMQPASPSNARSARQHAADAGPALHTCASCGASLNAKQYAAAKRWGRCGSCPKGDAHGS